LVEVEESKIVVGEAGARPFVVVGVPAFNEERTIGRVVVEAQRFAGVVVVCDDGSSDLTGVIAERLGAVVVRHERNLGKGMALKSIFEQSLKFKPDVVVTLDADGQHDPSEIPKLIEPIVSGESDVVLGNRYDGRLKNAIPLYRRVGLGILNWFNRSVNRLDVEDTQNGFRAYSFEAFRIIATHEAEDYGVESEQLRLAVKAGLRITEVPVNVKYAGLEKTSKKSPLAHGLGIIELILRMVIEERPLLFLGVPGAVSLFVGILFGVWLLHIYAVQHYIITNIALASIAFVMIGFFCLLAAIILFALNRLMEKMKRQN
jgi:glycosyltransferase involved in cell wall biosynthesis